MDSMRTFIAIMLPDHLKRIAARRQAALREQLRHKQLDRTIRWTAPDDMHLTLRFLGETTDEQRVQIRDELSAASDAWSRLWLALGDYGCFPNFRRPSVVWLGLGGELSQLTALQEEIEQIVQRAGFVAETRPFHPHLTIGRASRRALAEHLGQVGRIVQSLPPVNVSADEDATTEFVVDAIVHMRSQLQPTGAVYSSLDVFSIATGSSGS